MAATILTVEDDERIRAVLRMALEDEGYLVLEADRGERGIELARDRDPDLVLLDLMLPGLGGFDVCRELRRSSDIPIVMVTARDDTYDVVAGLEAGADDYVTKPFVVRELTARIRALLRRTRVGTGRGAPMQFGDVEIDVDAGEVRRDGEPARLTKTEFRVLCELAEHADVVLSRDQLLERVWGYDFLGDGRLVDSHIRRLRQKIEVDASNPALVITVRGLGYKLQS